MQLPRKMRLGGVFYSSFMSGLVFLTLLLAPCVSTAQDELDKNSNKVNLISVNGDEGSPIVQVVTEIPVGYRYTVYDSYDPVRVVIDLPGADVSSVQNLIKVGNGPLQEIRTSSFDLASGKLGRIELLLTREAKYKVVSEANLFSVSFSETMADLAVPPELEKQEKTAVKPDNELAKPEPVPMASAKDPMPPAKTIKAVRIGSGKIMIDLDGTFENYQYFHLRTPPRLVVDLYGVKPGFGERLYKVADGFSQIRVGESVDKTRFVLDALGSSFPGHKVTREENILIISWEGGTAAEPVKGEARPILSERTVQAVQPEAAPEVAKPEVSSPVKTAAPNPVLQGEDKKSSVSPVQKKSDPVPVKKTSVPPVSVESIDFKVENGKSVLTVSLSGFAEVTGPVSEKDLVRFGIKNATISRALRRTIDASSFPSAVKKVIPYIAEGGKEVRVVSELKGMVPYSLQQEKGRVILVVENQEFAEPVPPSETVAVPVPKPVAEKSVAVPAAAMSLPTVTASPVVEIEQTKAESSTVMTGSKADVVRDNEFTGDKISLVFDDANIRNILQLIGEVSNLNIIAGEDVKGTITLRLIDVPWDQALNLILESKGLGMLREGNVVRILPKEQLRALRQAEMTAVKEEKQLEQVVTEVVPINYTALGNITTPAKELLTDRGKITEDARNKQIIVTDIPSAIEGIKKLAAILDTPERQVMIEARIVEASSSFGRDLGVKWGISYTNNNGGPGDINNANVGLGGSFLIAPPAAGTVLGNAGLGSGITFGRVGIDSTVLDLRISALESAGYGKVISTPRVSTLNGGTASISQGTKIPYQSVGSDGTAKTEFVDANLSLTVQPVINPDDSIILDITATNSSIGSNVSVGVGSAPAIDTKEAKTKVIVRNGETTVIGGIFVETENTSQAGVPLLMKIPIIGHLFRSDNKTNTRSELLVFITPRIVQ